MGAGRAIHSGVIRTLPSQMSCNFIKSIKFENFKSFEKFSVACRNRNILVGPNNSGKSTVLDAVRVTADVLRFAGRRKPVDKSQGSDGVCATHVISPSLVSVDLRYCSYNYVDDPEQIAVTLRSGSTLKIIVPPGGQIQAYLVADGHRPRSPAAFVKAFTLEPVIIPTLSPLEMDEPWVEDSTVERNQFTRLAGRNFRNIWLRRTDEEFEEFSDLVAAAWGGIRLQRPIRDRDGDRLFVRMYFREGPSVREIQWAGYGFQVWMQIMMHAMRAGPESTLVLDEPDIYLHPDLQHRLLSVLNRRVGQFFIATHSTEIINEADPGDILAVDRRRPSAKRVKSEADYGEVYELLGSSENAEFARLARARRILFFEGKDRKMFRKLASKLSAINVLSDTETAYMQAGGFGQWSRVENTAWIVEQLFSIDVKVAAVFDRDYRSDAEIKHFLQMMESKGIAAWVLPAKETENFFIQKPAILRLLKKNVRTWNLDAELKFLRVFAAAEEEFKEEVRTGMIGEYVKFGAKHLRASDASTLVHDSSLDFLSLWGCEETRWKVLPGKFFMSRLADNVQKNFGYTLTKARIADEMTALELDSTFRVLISELSTYLSDQGSS